jgi:hypothetical protein
MFRDSVMPTPRPGSPPADEGQLVKLVYYKRSGRFYDQGELQVDADLPLFEIWDHVRALRARGRLPGLVDGAGREFIVSVDAPGHRHEHPRLLM